MHDVSTGLNAFWHTMVPTESQLLLSRYYDSVLKVHMIHNVLVPAMHQSTTTLSVSFTEDLMEHSI